MLIPWLDSSSSPSYSSWLQVLISISSLGIRLLLPPANLTAPYKPASLAAPEIPNNLTAPDSLNNLTASNLLANPAPKKPASLALQIQKFPTISQLQTFSPILQLAESINRPISGLQISLTKISPDEKHKKLALVKVVLL